MRPEGVTSSPGALVPGQEVEPAEVLFPLIYHELRALAHRWFSNQSLHWTLQPTALVHEAFVRLAARNGRRWENVAHFKAIAAKAMRQILVDHARGRRAAKRGGDRLRVTLGDALDRSGPARTVDMLDLDAALDELGVLDDRQRAIVELRFFGGWTVAEASRFLGLSERTVELDWRMARAWLLAKLEAA